MADLLRRLESIGSELGQPTASTYRSTGRGRSTTFAAESTTVAGTVSASPPRASTSFDRDDEMRTRLRDVEDERRRAEAERDAETVRANRLAADLAQCIFFFSLVFVF